jgi:hypothetical protein
MTPWLVVLVFVHPPVEGGVAFFGGVGFIDWVLVLAWVVGRCGLVPGGGGGVVVVVVVIVVSTHDFCVEFSWLQEGVGW